jgi:hypothetical protein
LNLYIDIRCVQVNLPAEGRDDPAAWPEVVNKIKESVVLAFDAAIVEREEEVKRGEAQRMMVGWNFCTWFLLKVSVVRQAEQGILINRNHSPTLSKLSDSPLTHW